MKLFNRPSNIPKPIKLNQKGFGHHIVLPLIVIAFVSFVGYRVMIASHAATPLCSQTTYSETLNYSPSTCVTDIQNIVNYYNSYLPNPPAQAGTGDKPYGPGTESNIAFFQSSTNTGYPSSDFTNSGVVDPATWTAFCDPIDKLGTPTSTFLSAMQDACGTEGVYAPCNTNGSTYAKGSSGDCVVDIQTMVNFYNANTKPVGKAVTVSGNFDNPTKTAVKFFQSHNISGYTKKSFTKLGTVDASTWTALCSPMKAIGTPPTSFLGAMASACGGIGPYGSGNTSGPATAITISGTKLVNGQGKTVRLLGFDMEGPQSACLAGTQPPQMSFPFTGYPNGNIDEQVGTTTLDNATAAAMASWHVNAVRIPLNEDCWLGVTTTPASTAISDIDPYTGQVTPYQGATYRGDIEQLVTALNNHGITTILGLFSVGSGTTQADSSWPMADADHAPAFWTSVASAFNSNPSVMFDLYNESTITSSIITDKGVTPWQCWLNGCNIKYTWTDSNKVVHTVPYLTAGMQQMVNAIRNSPTNKTSPGAGATQPIILGGLDHVSDPCGLVNGDVKVSGETCTITSNLPTDPLHQLAIDFHAYVNYECATSACWQSTLGYINGAGLPMITSELGEDDCSSSFLNSYTGWADGSSVNQSYLAWAWTVNTWTLSNGDNCVVGSQQNYPLLESYDGTVEPSSILPQPTFYQYHLAEPSVNDTE